MEPAQTPSVNNSAPAPQQPTSSVPQTMAVSNSSAVNYSALRAPIVISKKWLWLGVLGIVMVLIVFIVPVMVGGIDNIAVQDVFLVLFFGGFFLVAPAGFITYGLKYSDAKAKKYAQFLTDNGWAPTHDFDFKHVATSLLGHGDRQYTTQCFAGKYQNLDMHADTYQCTIGSGKSQQTYTFTNLSFELAKSFPLIVIDDKKNNGMFTSSLPERIKGGKALQLEGDFNERFRVTVLPDSERDVLQVLTPDFMEELLLTTARADIELEANKLFIITKQSVLDEPNLTNLFAMADVMLKNINELSDTWQASSSTETVQAMTEQALSPRNRIKIKRRHVTIGTIITIIIYILIAASGSGNN